MSAGLPSIIQVNSLRREFGKLTAVDDVSFDISRGEVFGFLGPNGAGKTTTINMLCTLLKPTAGSATVNGFDAGAATSGFGLAGMRERVALSDGKLTITPGSGGTVVRATIPLPRLVEPGVERMSKQIGV